MEVVAADRGRGEIVDGAISGGTNTSHTIVAEALRTLLATVPADAEPRDYEDAVLIDNILGKSNAGGRERTFRYLRELYLLRPDSVLFRALRDLWPDEPDAQPMLAGLCALARDSAFRASAQSVLEAPIGGRLSSADLAAGVSARFPESYGQSTLAKIGRNTFSSWEQTGHLVPAEHHTKERVRPPARPASLAYALMLGYLEGDRGAGLFETEWAAALDLEPDTEYDLAAAASARGLIEFRQAGGMIDVSFRLLLRPIGEE